jgi:WD40 repeat protein
VKDMKLLSSSFSSKDIECEYILDKQKYNNLVSRLKERLGQSLAGVLGNEEFRDEVVRKPGKTIKDIKARSNPIFEAPKFDELKSSSLKYIGAFELSKHASHHVLSSCLINGAYLATGHADSTLRIWQLNPLYFDTPYSSLAHKKISNEEMMLSATGAGSSTIFKKKDLAELKADPVVLPFELVLYQYLLRSSLQMKIIIDTMLQLCYSSIEKLRMRWYSSRGMLVVKL